MTARLLEQFENLVRRDPARRGLVAGESTHGPLCRGHLAQAAAELAERGRHVAIVTGFFVPHGTPPAAETDGPPGTMLLGTALHATGIEATVVTDERCFSAVHAAAQTAGFPSERVVAAPHRTAEWTEDFFTDGPGGEVSHLMAVERVGPSHDAESLVRQRRGGRPPVKEFLTQVPRAHRGVCHNARGESIDEHTGELHRLFEDRSRLRPSVKTIGIGDGGNEIGMGAVAWEELTSRLAGERAPWIPCRIATDWTIVAGTSNWGAAALAAAVVALRGIPEALREWDAAFEKRLLERMVEEGPAIDGITGRREPTVDGLPFATYIQPWQGIRRLLGLGEE